MQGMFIQQQQNSDGSAKRRLKQARRRLSGSSGSKKQKTEEDVKPAVQTSTGGKKRFSRKGREGVKDSMNKVWMILARSKKALILNGKTGYYNVISNRPDVRKKYQCSLLE